MGVVVVASSACYQASSVSALIGGATSGVLWAAAGEAEGPGMHVSGSQEAVVLTGGQASTGAETCMHAQCFSLEACMMQPCTLSIQRLPVHLANAQGAVHFQHLLQHCCGTVEHTECWQQHRTFRTACQQVSIL